MVFCLSSSLLCPCFISIFICRTLSTSFLIKSEKEKERTLSKDSEETTLYNLIARKLFHRISDSGISLSHTNSDSFHAVDKWNFYLMAVCVYVCWDAGNSSPNVLLNVWHFVEVFNSMFRYTALTCVFLFGYVQNIGHATWHTMEFQNMIFVMWMPHDVDCLLLMLMWLLCVIFYPKRNFVEQHKA